MTTTSLRRLSADGRWLAWAGANGIRVAPLDDVAQQERLTNGGDDLDASDPAWCSDTARLAYSDPDDGGLWTIDVDTVERAGHLTARRR